MGVKVYRNRAWEEVASQENSRIKTLYTTHNSDLFSILLAELDPHFSIYSVKLMLYDNAIFTMRMNIRVEQELKVNSYYKIAKFCNDMRPSTVYYHSEMANVTQMIDPPYAESVYLNMCSDIGDYRPILEFHTPSNIKKGWTSLDYHVLIISDYFTYNGENQNLKDFCPRQY